MGCGTHGRGFHCGGVVPTHGETLPFELISVTVAAVSIFFAHRTDQIPIPTISLSRYFGVDVSLILCHVRDLL